MIVDGGWANETDGEIESPTGFIAKIVISSAEAGEVVEAFEDEIEQIGLRNHGDLIGNFILTRHSDGFVSVRDYDTPREVGLEYCRVRYQYRRWKTTTKQGGSETH